jgi:DNA-binding beta-propeller fold protein YncE
MIWVGDPVQNSIHLYDSYGFLHRTFQLEDNPLGLAVDNRGRIFVGMDTRVVAFDGVGNSLFTLGSDTGEFILPNDIAVNSSGEIYVADSKAHSIKVYDPEGHFLFHFGSEGTNEGQFLFPAGIAIYSEGDEVYVTDQVNGCVEIFDLSGNWLRQIGRSTYSTDGGETWIYTGTFSAPAGLAVDRLGRLYVADQYQNSVQVLDSEGTALGFIGSYGTSVGQIKLPVDVAVRDVGCEQHLYVTSSENGSIEIFTLFTNIPGDVNVDGQVNILDVVKVINFILGVEDPSNEELESADINGDNDINILDVVDIVNMILTGSIPKTCPPGHNTLNTIEDGGRDHGE